MENKSKNINKNELQQELLQFLQESKQKSRDFYGRNAGSKPFKICEICDGLIIIEYDSYPKHYVLDTEVLLDGIIKVIEKKVEIHLTSDYASKIEYSTINRTGTNNKTSILTKFYYSIHSTFLKKLKGNE